MADVFISYARQSQAVAKRLAERLIAAGYEVWWDEQIPAHRAYAEVIEERLRAAGSVIVLWSQDAVRSQWVRAEADIARAEGKLIQAVVDGCTPPLPFDQLQHADLQAWTGALNHPGWRKIEASVQALTEAAQEAPAARPGAAHVAAARASRLPLLLGAAALAAVLGLGGWWLLAHQGDETEATVAVRPLAVADPALKTFAASVDDQIVGVLTDKGMTPLPTSGDSKAGLVVEGRVQAIANKVQVAVRVSTGRDHVSLWSSSFERPAGATAGFADQISGKVSDIMHCAVESAAPRLHLKNVTRSLYLRMCDLAREMDRTDEVFDVARQIEQQAPQFMTPMADVAVAGALSTSRLPPEQASRARAEATAAADRVLKADPDNANAYLAKSLLVLPHNDFLNRERWLDRGLARRDDPATSRYKASLNNYKANLLGEVGRLNDALPLVRRGLALDPKSPPKTETLVTALARTGDLAGARAQFEHLTHTWPDRPERRSGEFELAAFSDPTGALRLLEQPDTRPDGVTDAGVAAWRAYAKAKASRSPADLDQSRTLLVQALRGQFALSRDILVRALLSIGDADDVEAYFRSRAADGRFLSSPLFSPEATAFRRDPRFMALAHDIGLTAYWKASGKWPDFCSEPGLPYRCQDLAR